MVFKNQNKVTTHQADNNQSSPTGAIYFNKTIILKTPKKHHNSHVNIRKYSSLSEISPAKELLKSSPITHDYKRSAANNCSNNGNLEGLAETREIDNNVISATGRLETLPAANTNQPSTQVDNMSANHNSTGTPNKSDLSKNSAKSTSKTKNTSAKPALFNQDPRGYTPPFHDLSSAISVYLNLSDSRIEWLKAGAALKSAYGNEAKAFWCDGAKYKQEQKNKLWEGFGTKFKCEFSFIMGELKSRMGRNDFINLASPAHENEASTAPAPTPKVSNQTSPKPQPIKIKDDGFKVVHQYFKTNKEPVPTSSYLAAKQVDRPLLDARIATKNIQLNETQYIKKGSLIIPAFHVISGDLLWYQYITYNPKTQKYGKYFAGREGKSGGVYTVGKNTGVVALSESLSTSCTVNNATNIQTLACFGRYGIPKVALMLLESGHSASKIILVPDNDKPQKHGNTSLEACLALAKEYGFKVLAPKKLGDWNDHGEAACRQAFKGLITKKARKPEDSQIAKTGCEDFNDRYLNGRLVGITDASVAAIVGSAMGTGKTTELLNLITVFFKRHNRLPNLVYIAPLIRLNRQMVIDINDFVKKELNVHVEYMSFYQTVKKERDSDVAGNMAKCVCCTIHSIEPTFKHLNEDIDFLVFDESELAVNTIVNIKTESDSELKKLNRVGTVLALKKLGSRSKNIVLFDAFAGCASKVLAKALKPDNTASFITNHYQSLSDYIVKVVNEGTNSERKKYIESLIIRKYLAKKEHEVIPVFCMFRAEAELLTSAIQKAYPAAKVLLVTAKSGKEFSEVLDNKKLMRNYDFFIYTPAAGTGVSFDEKNLFTEMFCIAENSLYGGGVKTLMQGTRRPRNIKNNTIIILYASTKPVEFDIDWHQKQIKKEIKKDLIEVEDYLIENTKYEKGEAQDILIEMSAIVHAEKQNDHLYFNHNITKEFKGDGAKIVDINGKHLDINELVDDYKKATKAELTALRKEIFLGDKCLGDGEVDDIRGRSEAGLGITDKEEALISKYYFLKSIEMKVPDFINSDMGVRLQLENLSKKGVRRILENIQAAEMTKAQANKVLNHRFELTGDDPLDNASRFPFMKFINKKVDSIIKKYEADGFVSEDYFNGKPNRRWLARNLSNFKKAGLSITKSKIGKNPAGVYVSLLGLFGHEVSTLERARRPTKTNQVKPRARTISIQQNPEIPKALERIKTNKETIIDSVMRSKKDVKVNNLYISEGQGMTPVILNRETHERLNANLVKNIKKESLIQIWANPEDAKQPESAPFKPYFTK